ncbi:MAG TPA: biotin transporter BioY [Rhodospirillales bacterium]|nr:biotin transporter BioY [Rhodospirillales bacterium]
MNQPMTTQSTLVAALWPSADRLDLLRLGLLAIAGSLLMTLAAKIQVPFWPVPITMQTFATFVIGMAFGWRLAGATMLLYLGQGAIGMPVFTWGGGIVYFTGPTAGYLIGFLAAAVLVGWLAERGWDRHAMRTLAALALGELVILGLGGAWMAILFGPAKAWTAGIAPFLLGDALKIALAALFVPACWKIIGKLRA